MDCRTHERGVGMLNTPYVKKDTIKNFFPVPNAVFDLGLHHMEINIYAYLLRIEDRRTYQCIVSYYTIDSPEGQCCRWSGRGIAGPSVLAEHLIKTAFNLLFPLFLFLRREYRRKTFQHNAFPLKMDGFGFTLISNGLYH